MTVQDRIRMIRLMESMDKAGMKDEDGTYKYRDSEGKVLLEAKMEKKES